jgi:hypothetical protein
MSKRAVENKAAIGFTPWRKIRVLYHEVLAEGNSDCLIHHFYRTHRYAAFTKCKASGFKNLVGLYLLLGLEGLRFFVWRISQLWCFYHDRWCVLNGIPIHSLIVGLSKKARLLEFRNLPPGRLQNSFSPPWKPYICHYENKTNICVWKSVNLLHFNLCKPPTCFGHTLWPYLVYTNVCQQIGKEDV